MLYCIVLVVRNKVFIHKYDILQQYQAYNTGECNTPDHILLVKQLHAVEYLEYVLSTIARAHKKGALSGIAASRMLFPGGSPQQNGVSYSAVFFRFPCISHTEFSFFVVCSKVPDDAEAVATACYISTIIAVFRIS